MHLSAKIPGSDYGLQGAFIGISGVIGAGKSTLAKALGEELGMPVHYENVKDNPYLADFYRDQAKFAFPLQIHLLNHRFKEHQQIVWAGGGVQDRTIYEDSVFCKMLRDAGKMDERDYRTYVGLFANMSSFMRKPTLIVYLDVQPAEALRRIKVRGRPMEAGITLEYMEALHRAYADFVENISRTIPVVRVDYGTFRTAGEMARAIAREHRQLRVLRDVRWDAAPSGPGQ